MSTAAPKTIPIPLPPERYNDLISAISTRAQPAGAQALKVLRLRAGLSQGQAASLVHRKASTWSAWEKGDQWPTPDLIVAVCRGLGVPDEILLPHFSVAMDGDLDPRLYSRGDSTVIEYGFWLKSRGQIIQKIKQCALEGSARHAELAVKLWTENEQKMDSRASKPREITPGKSRGIIAGAMQQALPAALEPENEQPSDLQEPGPLDLSSEDPTDEPQHLVSDSTITETE